MKTKLIYLLFALATITFALSSCGKDDDVDPRESVIGSYNITEVWSWAGSTYTADDNISYNMTITKSSQSTAKVLIANLNNDNLTLEAIISGTDFTIPSQALIIDGVTVTFSGSGKYTATTLTFNYTAVNYPMYSGTLQIKGTLTSAVSGVKL